MTAEINQPIKFQGSRLDPLGRKVFAPTAWSSTGGTITADGTFSSSRAGSFKVIGRGRWKHTDTATVIVVPPADSVAQLTVSPGSVTLSPNATRSFAVTAYLTNGSTTAVGLNWKATGGTIDAGGTYTAGTVAGRFRVIASTTTGAVADTAVVTISVPTLDTTAASTPAPAPVPAPDSTTAPTPAPAPAPAPAPTPTLAAVFVTPTSASLTTGGSQNFRAYGRNSVGDSVPVTVSFTATGGTVTSSGLYTAGSTGGSFRVIAKEPTSGYADTAAVTVTVPPPPAPTLAAVFVTPTSASLISGGTQAFRAYGRNSVGDSVSVTVSFVATGGTVTSSGLYTAGTTGGSFRLIAKEATTGRADTAAVAITLPPPPPPPPAPVVGSGIPYGPFGLWSSATTVSWGPTPFTTSQNFTDPSTIVTQITAARTMKQKLVFAMTGGPHINYQTNGAFDIAKWKARMDRFNTTAIRNAVAQGVADGTIVGNSIMDEPEIKDWGGVVTKPMLDQMAAYAKVYFPTLPMGVNHGPNGYYQWRPTERYKVVDYVLNQYNWWVTKGDVAAWRDKVLAQAALDGITPGFSLNVIDGGVQDTDGTYSCDGAGQAGPGMKSPNCRMTADQVRSWGSTLVASGCVMLMWKYDQAYASRSDNQRAFSDVATRAAGLPGKACRRS